METSKLKNMIVLKNIPSNIIDEAIIVLKANKKIKKPQKVEQKNNKNTSENIKKDNQYILKEAEMIVNDYIEKIEKKDTKNIFNKEAKEKYNRLKKYSIGITIMSILQAIVILF